MHVANSTSTKVASLSRTSLCAASMLLLLLSSNTFAHPGHDVGGGFGAGLHHPFSGVDHVLAMISVGLLAAQFGGWRIWVLPAAFICMMVGGGLLALAGVHLPMVEQGIMASVLILGILLALARKLPTPIVVSLVGLFAVFHGYAHVVEMNAGHSPTAYAVGFVLATAILLGVGTLVGRAARKTNGLMFYRLAGTGIAACGVLLFMHVL